MSLVVSRTETCCRVKRALSYTKLREAKTLVCF